jgi:hypothetical protein
MYKSPRFAVRPFAIHAFARIRGANYLQSLAAE